MRWIRSIIAFLIILAVAVGITFIPREVIKPDYTQVTKIDATYGAKDETFSITDSGSIQNIMNSLNGKKQQWKPALTVKDYGYELTIYYKDGSTDKVILNGPKVMWHNFIFYQGDVKLAYETVGKEYQNSGD